MQRKFSLSLFILIKWKSYQIWRLIIPFAWRRAIWDGIKAKSFTPPITHHFHYGCVYFSNVRDSNLFDILNLWFQYTFLSKVKYIIDSISFVFKNSIVQLPFSSCSSSLCILIKQNKHHLSQLKVGRRKSI